MGIALGTNDIGTDICHGLDPAAVARRQAQIDAPWIPLTRDPDIVWTTMRGVPDGIHLGCGGHKRRPDVIDAALL